MRIARVPVPGDSGKIVSSQSYSPEERIMSSGTIDKTKGKLKEAGGVLLDDEKLKKEGQTDQMIGEIKETISDAGKAASDLVDKAADMIKGK